MDWTKLFEELNHGEFRFLLTKGVNRFFRSTLKPIQLSSSLAPVFLFSSTRSGSTWVFESLLRNDPYRAVFEPLPGLEETLNRYGTPRIVLDHDSDDPQLASMLTGCMGKNGHRRPPGDIPRINSRNLHFFTHGVAAKSTRANLCIDFVAELFRKTPLRFLYLIRNPYAVVRSRVQRRKADDGALGAKFSYDPRNLFSTKNARFHETFDRYRRLGDGLTSRIQLEAYSWCIENKVLLEQMPHRPWRLLVYENLFVDFEREFAGICDFLGNRYRPKTGKQKSTKSTTSFSGKDRRFIRSTAFRDPKAFLQQWRSFFSGEEIVKIREILNEFEIDYASFLTAEARESASLPE